MEKKQTLAKHNIIDFTQLDQENQRQLFHLLSIHNQSPSSDFNVRDFYRFYCQESNCSPKQKRRRNKRQIPLFKDHKRSQLKTKQKQNLKHKKSILSQNNQQVFPTKSQNKRKNTSQSSYIIDQFQDQSLQQIEAKSERIEKEMAELFIQSKKPLKKSLTNQNKNSLKQRNKDQTKSAIKIKQIVYNSKLHPQIVKNNRNKTPAKSSLSNHKKMQLIKKTKQSRNIDAHFAYSIKQFNLTLNGVCPHKLQLRQVKRIIQEIFDDMATKSHMFPIKTQDTHPKNNHNNTNLMISIQNKVILSYMEKNYKKVTLINLLYSISYFLLKSQCEHHASIHIFSKIIRNHFSIQEIVFFILTRQHLSNTLNFNFINLKNKTEIQHKIFLSKEEVKYFLKQILEDQDELIMKYQNTLFVENDRIDAYELLMEMTEDYKHKISYNQSLQLSHLTNYLGSEDQKTTTNEMKGTKMLTEPFQNNQIETKRSHTVKRFQKQHKNHNRSTKYCCQNNNIQKPNKKNIYLNLKAMKPQASKLDSLDYPICQNMQKLQQYVPKDNFISGIVLRQSTINALNQIEIQQWLEEGFWKPANLQKQVGQFEKIMIRKLMQKTKDFMQIMLQQANNKEIKNKIQKKVQDKAKDILSCLAAKNQEKLKTIIKLSKNRSEQSLISVYSYLEDKFKSSRNSNPQFFLEQNHKSISKLCKKILAVPEITDRLQKIIPYL